MEILLDNRDGNTWRLSSKGMANEENTGGITTDVSWKTERVGSPATFEFTIISDGIYQNKKFKINNGDIVRVTKDGFKIFYGYIFKLEYSDTQEINVTCYDQTRYLMNKDGYKFVNKSAADIIAKIAGDFKLKTGSLAQTKYKIPKLLEDNEELMDIIAKAVDLTTISTETILVFYDDFGSLTLKSAANMALDFSIGDDSLMTSYKYGESIDDETYNYVKLARDNKKSGKREIFITQDSANIAKWGKLQYFDVVNENLTNAQVGAMVNRIISLYNRPKKTFSTEAEGDLRVRAGCYIPVFISELNMRQNYLVESCTHRFDGDNHTMELELRVL